MYKEKLTRERREILVDPIAEGNTIHVIKMEEATVHGGWGGKVILELGPR